MALNIGSGEAVTIRHVSCALAQALKTPIPAEVTGKFRAGDIRHCYADISQARRLLGYEPKYGFAAGMQELAGWLRQQTAVDNAQRAARELSRFGLTA